MVRLLQCDEAVNGFGVNPIGHAASQIKTSQSARLSARPPKGLVFASRRFSRPAGGSTLGVKGVIIASRGEPLMVGMRRCEAYFCHYFRNP